MGGKIENAHGIPIEQLIDVSHCGISKIDAWGPATNGLSPAVSEGCGTWGNNILAGNVDYIHMLNVSKIAMPLDVKLPDGEKLFKD